jgi:hypothetical protein
MSKSFKEQSRDNWYPQDDFLMSNEQLKAGCLQRIADATEIMAKNYVQLQEDAKMYKEWWEQRVETCNRLNRRIAALQGVITKMKRRAKQ